MNHYRYHAADPLDPRFEAIAYVNAGELLFDIRVELESGERSISLRGPDQLRKILARNEKSQKDRTDRVRFIRTGEEAVESRMYPAT